MLVATTFVRASLQGRGQPHDVVELTFPPAAASPLLWGQFAANLSIVLGYLLHFRHETPAESQQADLVVESKRPHVHVARANDTSLVVNGEEFRVQDGRRRIPEDSDS